MQAVGIVAEYNPFHNGHALHIRKTKEHFNEPIITVMSGSFVQRGEPAFLDKWTRARLAILGGANLVIELPTSFSLRSAEFFARGSIDLLNATGLVENISCGAEHPENNFSELAQTYYSRETQNLIKEYLKEGLSYAAASEKAIKQSLSSPNDILAFEYAKACLKSGLKLHTIEREGSGYNDRDINPLSSASAIREAYNEGSMNMISCSMPTFVLDVLQNIQAGYSKNRLWQLIQYSLVTKTPEEIAQITECSEGLENLLKKSEIAMSLDEALKICSSKRYSTSRIRRLFIQMLFNKHVSHIQQISPSYIRILAFDDTGRELLKEMKSKSILPIINKLGQHPAQGQSNAFRESIELDIAATNIRELVANANPQLSKDFLISPLYIKKG